MRLLLAHQRANPLIVNNFVQFQLSSGRLRTMQIKTTALEHYHIALVHQNITQGEIASCKLVSCATLLQANSALNYKLEHFNKFKARYKTISVINLSGIVVHFTVYNEEFGGLKCILSR